MALEVDGKQMNVLPRDVQFDRVTDQPIHVDFMRVDPDTIVKVRVPVDFVNEADSPGLKRGAVLNVVRHSVEVRCKVGEIPTKFDADLAGLQINDAVKYSMVQVSGNVTPTIVGRDFVIATVTAPSALKRQMMDQAAAAADGDGDAEGGDAEEQAGSDPARQPGQPLRTIGFGPGCSADRCPLKTDRSTDHAHSCWTG